MTDLYVSLLDSDLLEAENISARLSLKLKIENSKMSVVCSYNVTVRHSCIGNQQFPNDSGELSSWACV